MFEYRVEVYTVRQAEAEMNRMAADAPKNLNVGNIAVFVNVPVFQMRRPWIYQI